MSHFHRIFGIALYILLSIASFTVFAEDSLSTKKQLKNPFLYKRGRFAFTVFPVASIDPASGMELGVMPVFSIAPPKDSIATGYYRASSVVSHLTYSTKNWANIRVEGQFFTSKGNNFVMFFQYLNAPDYFYGIGNDTINKTPSKYINHYLKCGFEASKSYKNVHFFGLKCDVDFQSIYDVTLSVLNKSVEGYNGGNIIGLGPIYKYDSRDNVNFPSKGSLLQTSVVQSIMLDNSGKYFTICSFDYRKYFMFFKTYYVALQGQVSSSSGDVPFYKLPSLGGKYNLRGISNKFMYIDKRVWFSQAEVRKMIYKGVGVVAFTGVGNAFATWDKEMVSHVKVMYGFGGRIQLIPRDQINLRIDYAFGPNGDTGFYATIREAF